jgi:hypothetical protein
MRIIGLSFALFLLWTCSMIGHLWRVVTGRPRFKAIADTPFTVYSFVFAYVVAVLVSLQVSVGQRTDAFILAALVNVLVALLVTHKLPNGNALLCAFLASSAVVELVATIAFALGLTAKQHPAWMCLWGFALWWISYFRFEREWERQQQPLADPSQPI